MSEALWRVATKVRRQALRVSASRRIAALERSGELGRGIAGAVRRAQMPGASSDDGEAFDRIESFRAELLGSADALPDVHFGAGRDPGTDATVRVADECAASAVTPFRGRFLFHLVRHFALERCLELGTNLGISGLYIGSALALNGSGRLVTVEGSPALARRAESHFARFASPVDVVVGAFDDALDAVLRDLGPPDFAVLDGNHDGPATLRYFGKIADSAREGAVVVLDDIAWSTGMTRSWETVCVDRRVAFVADFFDVGVCVVGDGPPEPRPARISAGR